MEQLLGLSTIDAARLKRLLDDYESGRLSRLAHEQHLRKSPIETYLAQCDSALGPEQTGTATVFTLEHGILTNTYYQIPVWNGTCDTIHGGDMVIAVREPGSGTYVIISPCGVGSSSSSSSSSSSHSSSHSVSVGNAFQCLDNVFCDAGGVSGNLITVTANVIVNGVSYPVSFTVTT